MRLKNSIILVVIFILLGAYVYFVEIKKHEKDQQVKQESKKVFTLVKDSINTLYFKNSNGKFSLKKVNNEWKITNPLETEGDNSTINSMLTSLSNAEKDKVFTVDLKELSNFGLDESANVVRVVTSVGEMDSILLGDDTPVGSYVFSYKSDSTVFTINKSVKSAFDKKLFDIRDRNILHFQRGDVRTITLNKPSEKYEFEKEGVSDWRIINIERPADNGKINSLLSKLETNKVKSFVDEQGTQLKKYGLHKPTFQVDLLLGPEKGQKRLFISKKINSKYYAKDDSRKPIFEVDSFLVKDINQKLVDFRSKDFADFERSEVNKIIVQYQDTVITCLKDTSNTWYVEDTTRNTVKSSEINSFFSNLDFANISEFVKDGKFNAASYGFDKPSVKLSLYKDDELIFQAILGKVRGDKVYATSNKYESVYLLPESKLKDFKLKLDKILETPAVEEDKEEETV
jgi:hypothetical protein